MLKAEDNVKDYASFWKSVKIKFQNPSTGQRKMSYVNYLTSNSNAQTIKTDKIATIFPEGNSLKEYTAIEGIYFTLNHPSINVYVVTYYPTTSRYKPLDAFIVMKMGLKLKAHGRNTKSYGLKSLHCQQRI